ncbi:MAG: methyl-accepting chemotaxis protein [Geobacteraceae bacterium]|nr:methyl-accepting chemotaxis protein [Geobacteraceae bacterium]
MAHELKIQNNGLHHIVLGMSLMLILPLFCALLRALAFPSASAPIWNRALEDVSRIPGNGFVYWFMGIAAGLIVIASGQRAKKTALEAVGLLETTEALNRDILSQKDSLEKRYRLLDENIKKIQYISNRIMKSLVVEDVLRLCAEGLHDVLGFERVNILMADKEMKFLHFLIATGSDDFNPEGVVLPLDQRIGVIHKCFSEQKLYLVDDMAKCSQDYYLQPPYDRIKPLRSKSFVLCPIVVKGESVGLFGIDNAFSRRIANASDEDTIRLFADQAASAITRINLLQAISTLTTELEDTFTNFLGKRDGYSRAVRDLDSSLESLFDSASRNATASESIMSSVEETSSAVGQISVSIDQVTNNLNFLAESIEKSVSAMEEIHASIKNVEKNAAVSHEISQQAAQQADKGREGVGETIDALAEIQKSVELSFEGIMRLSSNSGRISSIVKVIKDITKKTNLLALNASIIAAQAGEFGKDFGVVAEEMRALSHQTGQITGEIEVIISYILNDSETAARNITFSKDLVQKGVEIGHETGQTLKTIHEKSFHSMDMTAEIKAATEEQVRGIKLATQSIEDVSTMASQIYNASKEQSEATKNILRSIESIKDMTNDMVKATEAQVKEGFAIEEVVKSHADLSEEIFDSMELRKQQSMEIVQELDVIKGVSS